jgi:hypothetical protein
LARVVAISHALDCGLGEDDIVTLRCDPEDTPRILTGPFADIGRDLPLNSRTLQVVCNLEEVIDQCEIEVCHSIRARVHGADKGAQCRGGCVYGNGSVLEGGLAMVGNLEEFLEEVAGRYRQRRTKRSETTYLTRLR